MADKKISALTETTALAQLHLIPVVASGDTAETKKINALNLLKSGMDGGSPLMFAGLDATCAPGLYPQSNIVAGSAGYATNALNATNATNAANYVPLSLFDANSTIGASSDNTPVVIPFAEQSVFGRLTGGSPKGLTVAELQTLLFSAALPENVSIILDAALSADGKWSGFVEAGTAGAALAFGDLVYFQTADSRWELASADNAAAGHNLKLGICVLAAAGDASATNVLIWGKVRADAVFPALTIGAPVYMGTTAGDIVTTAPSGTTDIIRIVGYGNTADELYFNPSNDWYEHV